MSTPPPRLDLAPLGRLLRSIRAALLARAVIAELVLWSSVLGAVALVVAIALPGLPRWPLLAAIGLAPLIAWGRARRSRPSDADLVMWIDRRLEAGESVITAWEVRDRSAPHLRECVERASAKLAEARAIDVLPNIARRDAWALPFGLACFALAFTVPVPPPPPEAPPPDQVRLPEAQALQRIERLAEQRDAPARVVDAAARARELRRDLARGIERREALDRIEGLRTALEAARPQPTPEQRQARDAAGEALESEPELQEALVERDLESLERAVERAAARREQQDRERAREALRQAAEAARQAGDAELASLLTRSEELLARRAEQAALARELMEAMPELSGLREGLERLERRGDGRALDRAMVDAMRDAWSRLSQEERERLAEALRNAPQPLNDRAQDGSGSEGTLSADELEQQLRDALEHLDELQLQLGSGGMAVPTEGQGSQPGGSGGEGNGGDGNGSAAGEGGGGDGSSNGHGSPSRGGDHVSSDGTTRTLPSPEEGPLARVRPRMGPGAPSRTTFEWVDPEGMPIPEGPEGSATGTAVEGEPGAIERAPIPAEYRDQLREYFGGRREHTGSEAAAPR